MKTKDYYIGLKQIIRFDNKLKCKKGKPCGDICIPKKYKCREGQNTKVKPRLELTRLALDENKIDRPPQEKKSVKNLLEFGLNSSATAATAWYVGSMVATVELERKGKEIDAKYQTNMQDFLTKTGKDMFSDNIFSRDELNTLADIQDNYIKDIENYEKDFFGKFGWTMGAILDGYTVKTQLKSARTPIEQMRDANRKAAQDLDEQERIRKEQTIKSQLGDKEWHEWFEIDPTDLPQDPNERIKLLKKQWVKLSKQYHPDLASDPNDMEERNKTMQQINFIWSKLEENDGKFLY